MEHIPPFKNEFLHCTLIELEIRNEDSFGTGFFYSQNGSEYLITNLHLLRERVLDEDDYSHEVLYNGWAYPKSINIFFREDQSDLQKLDRQDIELFSDTENPKFIIEEDGADLVGIPLDYDVSSSGNKCLTNTKFVDDGVLFTAGDKVSVLGYPLKLYDPQTHFPVMREGLISTPLHIPYRGEMCFLIDARSHDGLSGSPVFTLPSSVERSPSNQTQITETPSSYLLGVFSEEEPSPLELEEGTMKEAAEMNDDEKPLDINKVWRIELVEKMLR